VGQGRLAPDVVLNGTYRIVRLVGKGGVGEVYEAVHDRLSKKRFAVKVLLEELSGRKDVIDRFKREADVLADLGHENIVEIIDFAQTPDGVSYLVMEFVDGVNLAEEIRLHGPMPPTKAAEIIGQLASALNSVHSRGIIHRDLKPQNVILARRSVDGREIVKILDFGIAKVREATIELTHQDAILGTPQYMSPEQASGHLGEIDERTDQFSLAAMAYELITGEPPFGGKDAAAILYRVVHEPPIPFRIPLPATEAAILRGMSKNKAQRFPSVREFHQTLAKAATTDAWPPPPVNQTLVEPKTEVEAPGPDARQPTAILPGKSSTTLSKAAGATTAERTVTTDRRRWLMVFVLLVSIAGTAMAMAWLRPRAQHVLPMPESVPLVQPSVPTPTPASMPDASAGAGRADAFSPTDLPPKPRPTIQPAGSTAVEPQAPPSRRPAGKKKLKIRNEEL
jgi:serine/threonine protein kinase